MLDSSTNRKFEILSKVNSLFVGYLFILETHTVSRKIRKATPTKTSCVLAKVFGLITILYLDKNTQFLGTMWFTLMYQLKIPSNF